MQQQPFRLGFLMALSLAIGFQRHGPVQGVQLADGTVYFDTPPRLVGASTTHSTAASSRATYYFTLEIPTEAGEPLQQITIAQREGDTVRQRVEFETEDSLAFVGTPRDRGAEISLGDVTFDAENRTLSMTFEPPIAPGQTVTVGIEPERNPLSDGVYLFGVTAFPAGASSYGQSLGFGRLHFYQPSDSIVW